MFHSFFPILRDVYVQKSFDHVAHIMNSANPNITLTDLYHHLLRSPSRSIQISQLPKRTTPPITPTTFPFQPTPSKAHPPIHDISVIPNPNETLIHRVNRPYCFSSPDVSPRICMSLGYQPLFDIGLLVSSGLETR